MDADLKPCKISIIVAMAEDNVIGRGSEMPWRLKTDLTRFRRITAGHSVIAGRKTHESIIKRLGHPLLGRRTIVLTRQCAYLAKGCDVVTSWEEALKFCEGEDEAFVIGGAEIYALALPFADNLYITRIWEEIEGDVFFPAIDYSKWILCKDEVEIFAKSEDDEYPFAFLKFTRMTGTKSFVNLDNARFKEQKEVMRKIKEAGICPFCVGNEAIAELMPVIDRFEYWDVRENRWPYPNTRLHLLIVSIAHAETFSQLSLAAASEFFKVLRFLEDKYEVCGGWVGMRFGDLEYNGGTVKHLHAHFIVPLIIDKTAPEYKEIKFRVV